MTRKIAVSAILFAVIVILGGVLNHQLMERRAAEFEQSAGYYSIYSATYEKNAADRLHPFGSREYVRIIRREEHP